MATSATNTKNQSYSNRVRPGWAVRFQAERAMMTWTIEDDEAVDAGRLVPGEVYEGTVRSESNAGFRGIEMAVLLSDGRRVSGISTGSMVR